MRAPSETDKFYLYFLVFDFDKDAFVNNFKTKKNQTQLMIRARKVS